MTTTESLTDLFADLYRARSFVGSLADGSDEEKTAMDAAQDIDDSIDDEIRSLRAAVGCMAARMMVRAAREGAR